MVKNHNNPNKLSEVLQIGDFFDLSIVEVITLQLLLRYPEPFIRHTLYLEVKSLLMRKQKELNDLDKSKLSVQEKKYYTYLKEKKNLSTSSFYNNLSNLEERGLVSFTLKENGKIESVESTQLAQDAIDTILRFLIFNNLVLEIPFQNKMINLIAEKLGKTEFSSLLIVFFQEILDIKLTQALYKLSNQTFVLFGDEPIENLSKYGLDKINTSSLFGSKIREANDFFEAVVLPYYGKNTSFSGATKRETLKELARVTKEGGFLVLVGRSNLPNTENYFTNKLNEIYSNTIQERILSSEQMEKDLKTAKMKECEVINYKGMLFGIGIK